MQQSRNWFRQCTRKVWWCRSLTYRGSQVEIARKATDRTIRLWHQSTEAAYAAVEGCKYEGCAATVVGVAAHPVVPSSSRNIGPVFEQ